MIPYLELNFTPSAIQGLTISPTMQSDLAEQSIKDFLKYCDLSFEKTETFIKKSKVLKHIVIIFINLSKGLLQK